MPANLPRRRELRTTRQLLSAAIATRLVVDTSAQIFNPFLAIFAAGTGVSLVTLGQLLSLRTGVGIVAPLVGSLADRFGYRLVMRLGLVITALGMLLIGLSNGLPLLVGGMVLSGLGLASFVPVLLAYVSERLPYERRARGVGILEYSWALASIVGLFAMGFVIEQAGWRAPFFVLTLGLLGGAFLFGFLPSARQEEAATPAPQESFPQPRLGERVRNFFRLGQGAGSAYAAIAGHFLIFYANFHVAIIYGGWLAREYGLSASMLGTVALILGFADLGGSVGVSALTDRFGKRRSVLTGSSLMVLCFGLLPLLNVGLTAAVIGLFLTRISFEFAIVSNMTLLSEQIPAQRGKVIALSAASALVGATLSGLTGPWAYEQFGVWGLGPVSAVSALIGTWLFWAKVREGGA
jgi:predicted MFS family arabinose efflux permease